MAIVESMRQQVGTKKETRALNTSWYKDYRWIHVRATVHKKV